MTALVDSNVIRKHTTRISQMWGWVKAATKILKTALVCIDTTTGYLEPGADSANLKVYGVAQYEVDNTSGGAEEEKILVFVNTGHDFATTGADETWKDKWVYLVDDNTVTLTASATTYQIPVGIVMEIKSATLVTVFVDGGASGLSTATALKTLNTEIPDVSTISTSYVVCPYTGEIASLHSVIDGTIATSDATLSFAINGTPVTGGDIVIEDSGSAAGDADSSTPTAAKTVAAGDVISVATDGASTNAVKAAITIVIKEV